MKKTLLFVLLVVVLVVLPLFSACAKPAPTTTTAPPTPTPTTTTAPPTEANWWDKFGMPECGGTLRLWCDFIRIGVDPQGGGSFGFAYEPLFDISWTLDRAIHPFQGYEPPESYQGILATSWERTDPLTVTVHLRQGVHWQNKPPVNGREFTSADVVYNFDRLLGTGSGFTTPNPFYVGSLSNLNRVVATDKYTVQFELNYPNPVLLDQIIPGAPMGQMGMYAPEMANQLTENDWKSMVGTGPYMIADYVAGSTLTYNRNPDYWGYDERYPQNKLPYIDTHTQVCIPDMSTAIAALRTGKIDFMHSPRSCLTSAQVQSIKKTNPDVMIASWPMNGYAFEMRCDKTPFNNIKVRQALVMSVDREAMAKTLYLGVAGTPCGLISPLNKDFCTSYDQWPADLQDIYSYNPTKAKALLADAGYPNGFTTTLLMSSQDDPQMAEILKANLADIGVTLDIDLRDPPTYRSLLTAGENSGLHLWPSVGSTRNPVTAIQKRASKAVSDNFIHHNDATFDDMCNKLTTVATMDEAKLLVKQADLYSLQQCWAINLFSGNVQIAWNPYIKGYSGETLIGPCTAVFARLWIDKTSQ